MKWSICLPSECVIKMVTAATTYPPRNHFFYALFLICFTFSSRNIYGQDSLNDPLDTFNQERAYLDEKESDADKLPADLVSEAQLLLQDDRPLDARTKLLLALQKEPNNVEAHYLLASYYTNDVGHFRLALKYAKRAEQLFTEQQGPPPYQDEELRAKHAGILYLLSQVRLNLDDYKGSLELLDQYSSYGYFSSWYPGTRAWVLMKLGNLDEAIKVARMGTLLAAEPGRTLNMLGILLSMKGERQTALDVLKKATVYELSQGNSGQPATPLNNSGEVYKEIFADDHAETSWVKATSLPDGCQHVLPSLNLTLLYIDQLNLDAASKTLSSFESCIAQFPLRNGEEHRSLVNLARGRIALHRGQTAKALEHLWEARQGRQWFGKIGTDQEDLDAATRISLFQALRAHNHRISTVANESISESVQSVWSRSKNYLLAWWEKRRGLQVLGEELSHFEDLEVRHTDSLLEYPSLGEIIASIPRAAAKMRIRIQDSQDSRVGSNSFYNAYLASIEAASGHRQQALSLIAKARSLCRPEKDELLLLNLTLLELSLTRESSPQYPTLALKAFSISRPSLRNNGFRLPVHLINSSKEVEDKLKISGFIPVSADLSPYHLKYSQQNNDFVLSLTSKGGVMGDADVRGASLIAVVRKLSDIVSVIDKL